MFGIIVYAAIGLFIGLFSSAMPFLRKIQYKDFGIDHLCVFLEFALYPYANHTSSIFSQKLIFSSGFMDEMVLRLVTILLFEFQFLRVVRIFSFFTAEKTGRNKLKKRLVPRYRTRREHINFCICCLRYVSTVLKQNLRSRHFFNVRTQVSVKNESIQ